jgi:hypothetical protein
MAAGCSFSAKHSKTQPRSIHRKAVFHLIIERYFILLVLIPVLPFQQVLMQEQFLSLPHQMRLVQRFLLSVQLTEAVPVPHSAVLPEQPELQQELPVQNSEQDLELQTPAESEQQVLSSIQDP